VQHQKLELYLTGPVGTEKDAVPVRAAKKHISKIGL